MPQLASPVFDWSTRDKELTLSDKHFRELSDMNAFMNDPRNFRNRKAQMLEAYEIPKIQAEAAARLGIQQEANKPAIARLEWEKSPDRFSQLEKLANINREPAMRQAGLARDIYEYQQSPQYVWQQEALTKAKKPNYWMFNPYEAGYFNVYGEKPTLESSGAIARPMPGQLGQGGIPWEFRKRYAPGHLNAPNEESQYDYDNTDYNRSVMPSRQAGVAYPSMLPPVPNYPTESTNELDEEDTW